MKNTIIGISKGLLMASILLGASACSSRKPRAIEVKKKTPTEEVNGEDGDFVDPFAEIPVSDPEATPNGSNGDTVNPATTATPTPAVPGTSTVTPSTPAVTNTTPPAVGGGSNGGVTTPTVNPPASGDQATVAINVDLGQGGGTTTPATITATTPAAQWNGLSHQGNSKFSITEVQ